MSKHTLYESVCALVLALVMAFGTVPVMAQSQASTGQIAGSVVDSQGAAVANATVKATNTQTGLQRSVTSSDDGLYKIVLLPPGIYDVSAEASGFTATTVNNVEVVVGRTVDVNITIGVSGVQEVVTVTAGAIQVQTTRSEADAVLNERAIENLPINGRRFQDFVTLTPSAQVDEQRGQISLSGQRGINSNVNVDGVDYNQPFFGGIRGGERANQAFTIPQESIKEFQVVAAGYSAEFGRSTGGIVNAVTKSGTNDFHGTAFYLIRPRDLARKNDYFKALEQNLRREVDPAPTQHQFGGSVGGPIKKDKMFFFGAYEQQRLRNPREVFFDRLSNFTPTPATQEAFNHFKSLETPFTQTNDAIAVLGRFDYEINSNHRFNIRYSHSDNEAINAVATGEQLAPTTFRALSSNGTERNNTHIVVGQFTSFFTTSLVNELRSQYAREERPREANDLTPGVEATVGSFGTRSFFPTIQFDWRFQIADSLTWTRGGHTVKFGGEWNHTFIDQIFGFNQFGVFSISGSDVATHLDILSLGGTVANRLDSTTSTTVTYRRQIGNLQTDFPSDEIAFFAQDSWRIRPNFTLNLGLRWEGQYLPTPEANNEELINRVKNFAFPSGHKIDPTQIPDQTDQFGPRLGFAWDPWNDAKTVVRGHAGIYYARTPLLILTAPFNNFRLPPGDVSLALPFAVPAANPNKTVYQQLKLIGIDLNTFSLGSLPVITPQQVQSISQALGLTVDPFRGADLLVMAEDYKNPKSYQGGLGIERELGRGLTVGADFTYINTVRLQRNRNLNLPLPIIRPTDPAQRPFFGLGSGGRQRPIPSLNRIWVRESTAHSLYRALTLRTKFQRRWGQLNVFYTLSKSLSDDDNERTATGVFYENTFDLGPEYNFAELDRRHQFTANPVFFLPWGIDVSSAIRLRSGRPVDAQVAGDANQDFGGSDRPFRGPGVPFRRNEFRNRALQNVDLRVQKRVPLGESRRLLFSAEFFNFFNWKNLEYQGSDVTNYCLTSAELNCGFFEPTNPNFLQLRDQRLGTPRFGQLLLNNRSGSPFQMQLGARFQF